MSGYWSSFLGGMLLGVSAVAFLLVNGRVAGVSGILGNLLGGGQIPLNAAFVVGLIVGLPLYALASGAMPAVTIATSSPMTIVAGLLVGIGSRMASGCTSGHGILGLARFSTRSVAASATFLAAGIAVATLTGLAS